MSNVIETGNCAKCGQPLDGHVEFNLADGTKVCKECWQEEEIAT